MVTPAVEVNFDGLAGPTHTHGGLAWGNIHSMESRHRTSRPRAAARQGLRKMKLLLDLGLTQGVLPPPERPNLDLLRNIGFSGPEARIVDRAWREAPGMLMACYSSSAMWAANAATVSPSADTEDGKVHITPANLVSQLHRSVEVSHTAAVLRRVFHDERRFAHHSPLPSAMPFSDEGAANHIRLCAEYGGPGIEVFVYGRDDDARGATPRFPARQSLEASLAVARLHRLDPGRTVFLRQNPAAIDEGVFHNDVVAVGNRGLLLFHSAAFDGGEEALRTLERSFAALRRGPLAPLEVSSRQLPLSEAVRTYLFNSQLLSLPDGRDALIAPIECRRSDRVRELIDTLESPRGPIHQVHYVDLQESMHNGGGPACLRLRLVMTAEELAGTHTGVIMDDGLYGSLEEWAEKHYRETLHPEDLRDPSLIVESRRALDELSAILGLRSLYRFQR